MSFGQSVRRRVQIDFGTEQITKQSHKTECDINNILSQFKRTGVLNHIMQQQPVYADLPSDLDYQSSQNTLIQAEHAFSTLPSVVRRFFDNDPSRLLQALGDPSMKDKLIELGVLQGPGNPQPPGNPEATNNPSINPGGEPKLPV